MARSSKEDIGLQAPEFSIILLNQCSQQTFGHAGSSIHHEGPKSQSTWESLAGTTDLGQMVQHLGSLTVRRRDHGCDIRERPSRARDGFQITSLPVEAASFSGDVLTFEFTVSLNFEFV